MRKDAITGDWVIIAAERGKRPQDFTVTDQQAKGGDCVFCYGNEHKTPPEVLGWRPGSGKPDSPGWTVRVFPNKYPAVARKGSPVPEGTGTLQAMAAVGVHEVIVDTPDHFRSLGMMKDTQAEQVLLAIADRYRALSKTPGIEYIQVFKNSGAPAGASLEHSHWQIIAVPVIPSVFIKEFTGVKKYRETNGACVYCQMISEEMSHPHRIIEMNDEFLVFAPFASRFPYETWVLPRNHEADFRKLSEQGLKSLGHLLRRTVCRLEKVFKYPPYNMVLHTSPPVPGYEIFHWHIEIIPRLTVTAGFELGTGIIINPSSPEMAAAVLRKTDPDILGSVMDRKGGADSA